MARTPVQRESQPHRFQCLPLERHTAGLRQRPSGKVKIFFSRYPGTLEEKALSRMGKKMMAGQLLYGEDVSSALVEDTGDASLVIDLIRAIQDGEELIVKADTQIFGTLGSDLVTASPLGSPTVRSRTLTTEQ